MIIGVLGGTFDPPHLGHQILAAEAMDQLRLDYVLWVLTLSPPHKKQLIISPVAHRLKMVEMVIEGNPKFILSRVDIDRPPPYYAVDTMSLLREHSPNDFFYFLMGMDSLNDLPIWHQPANFVNLCDGIVVMIRQGEISDHKYDDNDISGLGAKLHYLNTPIIEISSSDIRVRVKNGKQYRYLVPENVYQYISKNKLYLD